MFFGSSGDLGGNDVINTSWTVGTEIDRSSYTLISKLPTGILQNIGNSIQITIQAPAAGGTLNGVYISNCAASGNAYDADTTPTAITWNGGNTSLTMDGSQSTYTSDIIQFPFFISPKLIGFNLGSTTNAVLGYLPNCVSFYLTGVQEADDTSRTANYIAKEDTIYFLTGVQVL